MQTDKSISSIATRASTTYSKQDARIKAQMSPYFFDEILLPRKYVIPTPKTAQSATGILAVASVILPNILKDKTSSQK